MNTKNTPRPFNEWRADKSDRAEDAACGFGYHLVNHCRAEARETVDAAGYPTSPEEYRRQVAAAVDTALHNIVGLVEGLWATQRAPITKSATRFLCVLAT